MAPADNLGNDFVLDAASRGLEMVNPRIINSDQGTQYTSSDYINLVLDAGVRISMDGRRRAIDNVFTERFWWSLKYEQIYPNEYISPREVRIGIDYYINLYNNDRPNQALSYRTPAEVYFSTDTELIPTAVIHRPLPKGGESSLNQTQFVS